MKNALQPEQKKKRNKMVKKKKNAEKMEYIHITSMKTIWDTTSHLESLAETYFIVCVYKPRGSQTQTSSYSKPNSLIQPSMLNLYGKTHLALIKNICKFTFIKSDGKFTFIKSDGITGKLNEYELKRR